jgi:peptidoglycan hydrolase CwlO-like protein
VENLERWLAEGNAREHRLMRDIELWKNAADSHAKWAEMRQCDYECLRDKWSNLHHDKLDLKEEVASLTKKLEKTRLDRISLQGERGVLKKDLEECRQQLIGHSDPNIAEAAQKDARIRDLQEENVNLKKKVDLANGQLEYARGMYQDSSSRAVELALELEGLQKIFEPTKSQLDVRIFAVPFSIPSHETRAQKPRMSAVTVSIIIPTSCINPFRSIN